MGKKACCAKEGLNKGPWKPEEDKILSEYIKKHGEGRWTHIPRQIGLKRCGKSCRLRWKNYLKPDIKRGNISPDEEDLIIRLHNLLGNRWSLIAGRLPGRTDNEIKNHWNSTLRKRLQQNPKSPILNQNQPKILKQNIVSPSTSNNDPTSSIYHHNNNTNTNTNNVIRTKAIKCNKSLLVGDPIPLDELQKTTSPNPKTEERTHETTLTATEEGSLLRFGDLNIDFDGIHCEFNFSEFMDLDVLESANAKYLVSSEGMFGDWGSNDVSVQTKLDLNRPSTSSLDHDEDWLRD